MRGLQYSTRIYVAYVYTVPVLYEQSNRTVSIRVPFFWSFWLDEWMIHPKEMDFADYMPTSSQTSRTFLYETHSCTQQSTNYSSSSSSFFSFSFSFSFSSRMLQPVLLSLHWITKKLLKCLVLFRMDDAQSKPTATWWDSFSPLFRHQTLNLNGRSIT
jgi:hypothetical protein